MKWLILTLVLVAMVFLAPCEAKACNPSGAFFNQAVVTPACGMSTFSSVSQFSTGFGGAAFFPAFQPSFGFVQVGASPVVVGSDFFFGTGFGANVNVGVGGDFFGHHRVRARTRVRVR